MKILVTGASGFIGFHLVKRLLAQGNEVVGIDNNNDFYNPALKAKRLSKLESPKFKFIECDINDIQISKNNFNLAINLAAQPGVRVSKEREHLYESTNVIGFKSFCNFCMESNIDKIIYASSSSVYSDTEKNKFNESTSPLRPKSIYGKSKLCNEEYASKLTNVKDVSMIGLRFFSVYGPFGRPDMAYYSFTKGIKEDRTITLNNDGEMYRDMTYIEDIVEGILGAINFSLNSKIQIKNEIFNLGNDTPIKTSTLLHKIEQIIGKKAKITYQWTKNESVKTHADITKAKNLLGYAPKVSFDDGIKMFLDWHKYYEDI